MNNKTKMSNHSKYNEELFSMHSLESAYLPRMFSENDKDNQNEVELSFDSIPSAKRYHSGGGKSSGNVSLIETQSPLSLKSPRVEPYTLDKIGIYNIR